MTSVEILFVSDEPGAPLAGRAAVVRALARLFEGQGVGVRGHRVVGAEEPAAERALRHAIEAGGLVVCLGEGDGAEVVRQALGRVLGSRLVLSDSALDGLAAGYARQGRAMPRRAEALALIPQGALVLRAAGGGEPGLLVETGGALVALLPDDVTLAAALAREHLLPRLAAAGGEGTLTRTLRLVGLDLADVAARLGAALRGRPATHGRPVAVEGEVWVRVSLRAPTAAAGQVRFAELEPALRAELGAAWFGVDDERLEGVVGRLLRERGLTLALAESCTGGLIGHRLTDVAGSSRYFERGLVVYSNAAKQTLLGVPEALIGRYGAVSAECAEAMARGVRVHAGTDLGLSATGVAGPDGGSAAKPVGTVFLGLADARTATVQRHRFDRDREGNKALAALMGLDLVRRYCLALGESRSLSE
jgi:nicotinamide-nucleotide amidase